MEDGRLDEISESVKPRQIYSRVEVEMKTGRPRNDESHYSFARKHSISVKQVTNTRIAQYESMQPEAQAFMLGLARKERLRRNSAGGKQRPAMGGLETSLERDSRP